MPDLIKETNFINYLKILYEIKDECIIVMAAKDTMAPYMGADGCSLMSAFGLTQLGKGKERRELHWKGYIAIIDNGALIFEKLASENKSVHWEGKIKNKEFSIFSSPIKSSNIASIAIDGDEYSVGSRGINIVVVEGKNFDVIDSVCFDTFLKERPAKRLSGYLKTTVMPRPAYDYLLKDIDTVINSLKIDNIIPAESINSIKNICKKTKVRIFFWGGYNLWNALESVVGAFDQDPFFDVLVIVKSKDFLTSVYIARNGLKVINDTDYIISMDEPEIAIYNWVSYTPTYDSLKLKIDISPCMVAGGRRTYDIDRLCKAIADEKKVDSVIVEKHIYKDIIETFPQKKNKWHGFSNPQFDLIFKVLSCKPEIPDNWEKLLGKNIVLWAFDHMWDTANVTFDLYIKFFLDFFKSNTDIGLIIRPHRNYPIELLTHYVWTKEDLDILKTYCALSENIVWDEHFDYGLSYSLADAVITDINCGIVLSALALDKPIATLKRYDHNEVAPQYPDIYENNYKIDSLESAKNFFIMLQSNDDPQKDKRNQLIDKYIGDMDGKNGKRIKDFIVSSYEKTLI